MRQKIGVVGLNRYRRGSVRNTNISLFDAEPNPSFVNAGAIIILGNPIVFYIARVKLATIHALESHAAFGQYSFNGGGAGTATHSIMR